MYVIIRAYVPCDDGEEDYMQLISMHDDCGEFMEC